MKLTREQKDNIISFVIIIGLIAMLILAGPAVYSQSIMIDNQNRTIVACSEEEKAIKISSNLIKAKTDVQWETHINKVKVIWKIQWNKDIYVLYKNNIKYYESTTISGIRSKYASDLLGKNINIQ